MNLGSTVNSSTWDIGPDISADGLTLYLTSQRPGGSGDRDLAHLIDGPDGPEFVVVPASESATGKDVTISETDIAVFIRSKGAIYTAAEALVTHMGLTFEDVEQVFIAGGFGYHLDIANTITIGLLPDLPMESVHFLGNGSLAGARMALMSTEALQEIVRGQVS